MVLREAASLQVAQKSIKYVILIAAKNLSFFSAAKAAEKFLAAHRMTEILQRYFRRPNRPR
jgi:hypothetical protein